MRPLFCPLPNWKRAEFLHNNLKNKLKESLEYLIETNKEELGDYYVVWKSSLLHLQSQQKIPSIFYSLNSRLAQESMAGTAGNVAAIASYIDVIIKSSESPQSFVKYKKYENSIENRDFENSNPNLVFLNFREDKLHKTRCGLQKKYILFDLPMQADIYSPDEASALKIQMLVTEALKRIAVTHEAYYQEMLEFISEIMILKSDHLKAGSSFDLFGMVYINETNAKQSVINMMDLLIHEAAHYYLYCLSIDDPLVVNDYQERYFSPIKGRERPMIGVYHAAFVLFRVLKFLSFLSTSDEKYTNRSASENNLDLQEKKEIAALNTKYSQIVAESLETVLKFGRLTELGDQLIRATEREFDQMTQISERQTLNLV